METCLQRQESLGCVHCGEHERRSRPLCNPPVLQEDQTPAPEPQPGVGGEESWHRREPAGRWHLRATWA